MSEIIDEENVVKLRGKHKPWTEDWVYAAGNSFDSTLYRLRESFHNAKEAKDTTLGLLKECFEAFYAWHKISNEIVEEAVEKSVKSENEALDTKIMEVWIKWNRDIKEAPGIMQCNEIALLWELFNDE